MSPASVTEITAASAVSFDDALRRGVSRAARTVPNIECVWVKEMKREPADGAQSRYRVTFKVSSLPD